VPAFGQGQAEVPVVVARPGTAPGSGAPAVSVVPPIVQPAAPSLLPPISPSAPAAPSIAPPGASLSPLFAPYVPSAASRAQAAPLPALSSAAGGDVTGTITQQPVPPLSAAPAAPAPTSAPIAAPAIDRLPPAIGGAALIAAANAGEPAAAYEVATRFAEGHGVPQSFPQAAIWYERAAKGGLAPALFRLGALYEKGEGVPKDLNEARRLYLAAADKGNVNAMHNIGVLYAEGIDGKPDFKSASQWFRKSAMYGVADSQYNLAVLYARGIGLDRDFAEAFRWFSLAAKSGDADAGKKRDEIASHLDPKTLAVARQAVDGFAPQQAPEEAATVKPPPGGWDQAQPAKRKPASSARARSKDRTI
jgi:localization factor PodJL